MAPSRSTREPSRFDPLSSPSGSSSNAPSTSTSSSVSRPHGKQKSTTIQPDEVIVVSSDEDNDEGSVIVISDDDETPLQPPKRFKNTRPTRPPKSRKPTHGSSRTQTPLPKDAVRTGAAGNQPVTIARILSGEFGHPKTWSFGLPEPNFVDIEKLIEEGLKDPMLLFNPAQARLMPAGMRALNPKVFGAHPDENDRTVRYTHVERYPGGPVWFTVRWWAAGLFGTYFDLVDVPTRKLFLPHRDLSDLFVQVEFLGAMVPVGTVEDAMRLSRGVKKIPGANDDERYQAPEGARVLFSRILPNGKREPVADRRSNVTVDDIERNRYGDPTTWTFGVPEENRIDLQNLVQEAWRSPWIQAELLNIANIGARNARWNAIRDELLAIDSKVYGAHPVNDPSVRYMHIELYSGGPVWFTIRWWDGDNLRTFFDLVDVRDRRVLCPRLDLADLQIIMTHMGTTCELHTIEEGTRRSRGVSQGSAHREERYVAPPGARLYIYKREPNPPGGRRHIANAYVPAQYAQGGSGLWPQLTSPYSSRH
ncbi:uncharacterized protein STEHIDRAFT_154877 [Stereum hirsutum FP-91666 SS1]|uniref:uncharacterized protein n=1 Tax=Stereum hirsutum (strain FP-91666) TaxID=721885 RepID=UPI000440A985|nr:uncharacterized protein STEHIDRAFT_154877 [Stereum hirsutum FP-91666 SS1]EIM89197.1 hypothetical protein STEHIDRAFT_154877 [Stereum hirsutum FP-91666 SS1]